MLARFLHLFFLCNELVFCREILWDYVNIPFLIRLFPTLVSFIMIEIFLKLRFHSRRTFYLQKGCKGGTDSVCFPLAWFPPLLNIIKLPGTFVKTKTPTLAHDCWLTPHLIWMSPAFPFMSSFCSRTQSTYHVALSRHVSPGPSGDSYWSLFSMILTSREVYCQVSYRMSPTLGLWTFRKNATEVKWPCHIIWGACDIRMMSWWCPVPDVNLYRCLMQCLPGLFIGSCYFSLSLFFGRELLNLPSSGVGIKLSILEEKLST